MSRSLRRSNPITLLLAAILCIGFVVFFFSGGDGPSLTRKTGPGETASSPLSPPSLPFRKSKANAPQAAPPVVHYYMNNITTSRTPIENEETVLILTPMARFYDAYWDNLLKLSYPHSLISLGFIIPKTKEGNAAYAALQAHVTKTQSGPKAKRFAAVSILRQDTEIPLQSQDEAERHKMENQKVRRAAMAKARNSLLFTTMGPTTSWVLWMDADVVETPPPSSKTSPPTTCPSSPPTASSATTTTRRRPWTSAPTTSTTGSTAPPQRSWAPRWARTTSCSRATPRWRPTAV